MAVVSALRGGRLPLFHHHHMGSSIASSPSLVGWCSLRKFPNFGSNSKGFTLFARYSQAQDVFSSRFQGTLSALSFSVNSILYLILPIWVSCFFVEIFWIMLTVEIKCVTDLQGHKFVLYA